MEDFFQNKAQNKSISIYNIFENNDERLAWNPRIETTGRLQTNTPASDVPGEPYLGSPCSYSNNGDNLASLELAYEKDELISYTESRKVGVSKRSGPWLDRASRRFWDTSRGVISKTRMDTLRTYALTHYTDVSAKRKTLNFAKAFLKYLATTHFDPRYHAFALF